MFWSEAVFHRAAFDPTEEGAKACPWYSGHVDGEQPPSIQGGYRLWHRQMRLPAHRSQPGQFQVNGLRLLVARFVHPQQVLTLFKQPVSCFWTWQAGGPDAKEGIPGLAHKVKARLINPITQQGHCRQLPHSSNAAQSSELIEWLHASLGHCLLAEASRSTAADRRRGGWSGEPPPQTPTADHLGIRPSQRLRIRVAADRRQTNGMCGR